MPIIAIFLIYLKRGLVIIPFKIKNNIIIIISRVECLLTRIWFCFSLIGERISQGKDKERVS